MIIYRVLTRTFIITFFKFKQLQDTRSLINFPDIEKKDFFRHFPDGFRHKTIESFSRLLKKMLNYDTNHRFTAHMALQDIWLKNEENGRSRNSTMSR